MIEIIPKMLPNLSNIKSDQIRYEVAILLTSLCETFMKNIDKPNYQQYLDVLRQIMSSVYDIVMGQ